MTRQLFSNWQQKLTCWFKQERAGLVRAPLPAQFAPPSGAMASDRPSRTLAKAAQESDPAASAVELERGSLGTLLKPQRVTGSSEFFHFYREAGSTSQTCKR